MMVPHNYWIYKENNPNKSLASGYNIYLHLVTFLSSLPSGHLPKVCPVVVLANYYMPLTVHPGHCSTVGDIGLHNLIQLVLEPLADLIWCLPLWPTPWMECLWMRVPCLEPSSDKMWRNKSIWTTNNSWKQNYCNCIIVRQEGKHGGRYQCQISSLWLLIKRCSIFRQFIRIWQILSILALTENQFSPLCPLSKNWPSLSALKNWEFAVR